MTDQASKVITIGPLTASGYTSWHRDFLKASRAYGSAGREAASGISISYGSLEEVKSHVRRDVLQPDGITYLPMNVPWDDIATEELIKVNRKRTQKRLKLEENRCKLWVDLSAQIEPLIALIQSRAKVEYDEAQRNCQPVVLMRLIKEACKSLNENRVGIIQAAVNACYQNDTPYDIWNEKLDDLLTDLSDAGRVLSNGDKVIYLRDLMDIDLLRATHPTIFSLNKASKDLPEYNELRRLALKTWNTLQARAEAEKLYNRSELATHFNDKPQDSKGQESRRAPKRKFEVEQNDCSKQICVLSVKNVKAVLKKAGIAVSQDLSQKLGNAIQVYNMRRNLRRVI